MKLSAFLFVAVAACSSKEEPAPRPAPEPGPWGSAAHPATPGSNGSNAAPASAGKRYDAVSRADFNRLAVRENLPIYWIADTNGDKSLQPDEVASLLFYPTEG